MSEEDAKLGRPFKFNCPKELQEQVDIYFTSLMDDKRTFFVRPPTVSGLALHLDISTRALLNYGKGKVGNKDLIPIVTRAKQRCEAFLEEMAITGKTKNPISLLSMNFGRHEKQVVDINQKGDLAAKIIAARKRVGIKQEEDDYED